MKKLALVLAVIALSLSAFAKPSKVDIKTNITCGGCVSVIKGAMKDVKGIENTSVDVETKVVSIDFDDEVINTDKLSKLIADAGYSAEVMQDGKVINAEPKQCSTDKKASGKQCSTDENKTASAKQCGSDKNCCKDKKG